MSTQAVATQVEVENIEVTSEIASEVVKVKLAPEAELKVLITFSEAYKSFNQSLTVQVVMAARVIKTAFGVRQGYAGATLMVEGHEMEWKTFVKKYFGITPRRFNQILELEDEEAGVAKLKAAKKAKASTTSAAPADEAGLAEKFDDIDAQLHVAAEENKRLRAELEKLREEIDPVEMICDMWSSLQPEHVQAELTKIIKALNLSDCLTVEIDEVR